MRRRKPEKVKKTERTDKGEGQGGAGVPARKTPRPEPPRELAEVIRKV